MQVEIIPYKSNGHTIYLRVTDKDYTSHYYCSSNLEIGLVYKHSIENHYKELARQQIQKLVGSI